MASLAELCAEHADVSPTELEHLQRLAGSWGLLADFCFADLLLFVPIAGTDGTKFVIAAQRRPTTSQTLYRHDHVGEVVDEVERPIVARAHRTGSVVEGEITLTLLNTRARVQGIPVTHDGRLIAVLTREFAPWVGRQPGELERVYLEIFARFARMIVEGEFPFAAEDAEIEEAPRVGDGVILLDEFRRVSYASPNAVSALHRARVHANAEGMRLSELGFEDSAARTAYAVRIPVTEEVERGSDTVMLLRVIPLLEHRRVTGAVLLIRDISDVRRRDRLLMSKDATIREIHHRVKNNLQTISSLLRLQGRRMSSPEARAQIEESVRRIRSIATVHETLSRETGEWARFTEVVRPLVRIVEESFVAPDQSVSFEVHGDPGRVPAEVTTPLAVVITEMLQNAVDHAYPDRSRRGRVVVDLVREDDHLLVEVTDDGVGVPEGFQVGEASGLGLSIMRALVVSELRGTLEMSRVGPEGGTRVRIAVPIVGVDGGRGEGG